MAALATVLSVAAPALPASAADEPALPLPSAGIPCYDGAGPRVSVFYLYAQGQPDDLGARLSVIRDAAAQVDATFDASAHRTGGSRHVRFRMSDCQLAVTSVAVPKAAVADNLAQLKAAHLVPPGDDALAFAGPTLGAFAGDATRPVDTSPGAGNASNAGGYLAEVGYSFWGAVDGPASMLARALGAVQTGAPHASAAGGCTDGADPLCYDDLTIPAPVTSECGAAGRYLLDCGNDDYFSTAPVAGSWLAGHWNIADSVFLTSAAATTIDPVEAVGVTLEGVPANGRVGPQTPLTVRVSDSQPLDRIALVSDRSPGIQPLVMSGSSGTGSLRSLSSYGPGLVFALITDRLGRERLSPAMSVTYVRGAVLTLGSPAEALVGSVPYTVQLDLSGDQSATSRFLIFRAKTDTVDGVVLADITTTPDTTQYTGTIDTTKLGDGDGQQFVLTLVDANGTAVPGAQTSVVRSVSNARPALSFGISPDSVLPATTSLTATVNQSVSSIRYAQTTTDCASGRVIGEATTAPYAVTYLPAIDWQGPDNPWGLCATAVTAGGATTTVGPVSVTTTEPDGVELRLTPGTRLSVGLHRLPVVVTAASHRQLRALELFETATLFARGGHLVMSQPVAAGTLPTSVDFVVPPGYLGSTELYVRAIFANGAGEFLRTAAVPVTVVVGPAPTMTLSSNTLVAGGKVLVSGTAPPGAQLRLLGVSRPATAYTILRQGAVPADGKYSAALGPVTNTRVYAEIVGGGHTASQPISVRSAVSFGVVRTGVRTYRFSGSVSPHRAGMTVTVARRVPTGGAALVRTTTTADGRWTATFRFPVKGTFDVFAVASPDAVNAQGASVIRRLLVS